MLFVSMASHTDSLLHAHYVKISQISQTYCLWRTPSTWIHRFVNGNLWFCGMNNAFWDIYVYNNNVDNVNKMLLVTIESKTWNTLLCNGKILALPS